MAKISKRIVNSYAAYLNYREKWHDKGYGLDRQLTLKEYAQVQRAAAHDHRYGEHIARGIAGDDRTFTRSEAAAITRRLKTADRYEDVDVKALKELQERYRKPKDIYSFELTKEELDAQEQRRRQYWIDRGKTPKHTIQANARSALFDALRDAGLSYKEADEVMYG